MEKNLGLSCSSGLCISLAHPDIRSIASPLSALPSLGPCSQPYRAASCEHWAAAACPSRTHHTKICPIISTRLCFLCAWAFEDRNWLLVCHFFCTRKARNVLGSMLYTPAVWPHVQNGASILLVIVMPMWGLLWLQRSQKSLCYLRSAENVRLPPQSMLTRPNMLTYKWHRNCTFTRLFSDIFLVFLCRKPLCYCVLTLQFEYERMIILHSLWSLSTGHDQTLSQLQLLKEDFLFLCSCYSKHKNSG